MIKFWSDLISPTTLHNILTGELLTVIRELYKEKWRRSIESALYVTTGYALAMAGATT